MRKCKWAGDAGDEYCKDCNGIDMIVDGNSISCTECAGYEEGEEVVEETKQEESVEEETTNPPQMNPPKQEEPKKEEAPKDAPKKSTKNKEKKEKTSKTTSKKENVENDVKIEQESTASEVIDGVNVLSLCYMSGCTVQKGESYFKFNAQEEWKLDINIINTTEKIEEVREKLWAKLNAEVDKQVEDVLNS